MKKRFLVVVDMQNDFITGSLGSDEAQKIVPNVIKEIENFDGEIIATLDMHDEDYLKSLEGKKLPVQHCVKDTDGWQIEERIKKTLEKRGYTALTKPTFGSVSLVEMLKKEFDLTSDIEIELVGVCTDICVVSNALLLKAYFPEAKISVNSLCCAGVTPEKHEAALETMRSCQINVK